MKCLSLKQPFAELLVSGKKTVELRKWNTKFRDKSEHYADIKKFDSYKYGFMVKNAHRLRTPLPYPGRLKFFEVEYPVP
jgi:hypothetical protein